MYPLRRILKIYTSESESLPRLGQKDTVVSAFHSLGWRKPAAMPCFEDSQEAHRTGPLAKELRPSANTHVNECVLEANTSVHLSFKDMKLWGMSGHQLDEILMHNNLAGLLPDF